MTRSEAALIAFDGASTRVALAREEAANSLEDAAQRLRVGDYIGAMAIAERVIRQVERIMEEDTHAS